MEPASGAYGHGLLSGALVMVQRQATRCPSVLPSVLEPVSGALVLMASNPQRQYRLYAICGSEYPDVSGALVVVPRQATRCPSVWRPAPGTSICAGISSSHGAHHHHHRLHHSQAQAAWAAQRSGGRGSSSSNSASMATAPLCRPKPAGLQADQPAHQPAGQPPTE
jgi:hypothetical protein